MPRSCGPCRFHTREFSEGAAAREHLRHRPGRVRTGNDGRRRPRAPSEHIRGHEARRGSATTHGKGGAHGWSGDRVNVAEAGRRAPPAVWPSSHRGSRRSVDADLVSGSEAKDHSGRSAQPASALRRRYRGERSQPHVPDIRRGDARRGHEPYRAHRSLHSAGYCALWVDRRLTDDEACRRRNVRDSSVSGRLLAFIGSLARRALLATERRLGAPFVHPGARRCVRLARRPRSLNRIGTPSSERAGFSCSAPRDRCLVGSEIALARPQCGPRGGAASATAWGSRSLAARRTVSMR